MFNEMTGLLTPIMASFTRSFWTSSALNRFSINSVLVEPEQYHAILVDVVLRLNPSARALFPRALSIRSWSDVMVEN